MKTWQEPGTTAAAAWRALTTSTTWETSGGVWASEKEPDGYLVIEVIPNRDLAHARWMDLGELTAPDRRRFGIQPVDPPRTVLLLALREGWGEPAGIATGTPVHARSTAKGLAEAYTPQGRSVGPLQLKLWTRAREASPAEYLAGFMSGMKKGAVEREETTTFLAGWDHGWEYASGRTGLPRWFTRERARQEVNW